VTVLFFGDTNGTYGPDIMVIGFQEIVLLTVQQLVQAEPELEKKNEAHSSCFGPIMNRLRWKKKKSLRH
jgi:hypothetical protein